jgi:hypothetical protein
MADRPGPTGEFPQGRLNSEDEGELAVGLAIVQNRIVMHFGKPIVWVGMSADDADNLIAMLTTYSKKLRAQS